jgi:hypothetical protein
MLQTSFGHIGDGNGFIKDGGNDKTEPWLANAKDAVHGLWEEEYKEKYRTTQLPPRQLHRKNRQDSSHKY